MGQITCVHGKCRFSGPSRSPRALHGAEKMTVSPRAPRPFPDLGGTAEPATHRAPPLKPATRSAVTTVSPKRKVLGLLWKSHPVTFPAANMQRAPGRRVCQQALALCWLAARSLAQLAPGLRLARPAHEPEPSLQPPSDPGAQGCFRGSEGRTVGPRLQAQIKGLFEEGSRSLLALPPPSRLNCDCGLGAPHLPAPNRTVPAPPNPHLQRSSAPA